MKAFKTFFSSFGIGTGMVKIADAAQRLILNEKLTFN